MEKILQYSIDNGVTWLNVGSSVTDTISSTDALAFGVLFALYDPVVEDRVIIGTKDATPSTPPVTCDPLTTPWIVADVGNNGSITGDVCYDSSTDEYKINSAGDGIVTNSGDGFTTAYQTINSNSFSITARLRSIQVINDFTIGAIIVAEDITSTSTNAVAVKVPANNDIRTSTRVNSNVTNYNTEVELTDVWLRIIRLGDNLTSQYSNDGANWTDINTTTISGLNTSLDVGIAGLSNVVTTTAEIVFTDVNISTTSLGCTLSNVSITAACTSSANFEARVSFTGFGSYTISDNQGSTPVTGLSQGTYTFGTYPVGTNVTVTVSDPSESNCSSFQSISSTCITTTCPGGSLPALPGYCLYGMSNTFASYRDNPSAAPSNPIIGSSANADIYIVDTLMTEAIRASSGDNIPGTFRHAIESNPSGNRRYVLFEVGGANYATNNDPIVARNGSFHIAGQTAPSHVYLIGTELRTRGQNSNDRVDMFIEHMTIIPIPDDNNGVDNKSDCFQMNLYTGDVVINKMTLVGGLDEVIGLLENNDNEGDRIFNTGTSCTMINSISAYADNNTNRASTGGQPSNNPHSKGSLFGGNNKLAIWNTAFSHNRDRNPKLQIAHAIVGNMLMHDIGIKGIELDGSDFATGSGITWDPNEELYQTNYAVFSFYRRIGPSFNNLTGNGPFGTNTAFYNRSMRSTDRAFIRGAGEGATWYYDERFSTQPDDGIDYLQNAGSTGKYVYTWEEATVDKNGIAVPIDLKTAAQIPNIINEIGNRPGTPDELTLQLRSDFANSDGVWPESFGEIYRNNNEQVPNFTSTQQTLSIPSNPYGIASNGYTNIENWLRALDAQLSPQSI